MKSFCLLSVLLLAVVCTTLGNPTEPQKNSVTVRQQSDPAIFSNLRKLIQDLVANLRKAAQQALDAVGEFGKGIQEQFNLFRQKLLDDLQKVNERITQIIENITGKFTNSSEAVKECIESHRNEANQLFNSTVSKTLSCADDRINDIGEKITELKTIADEANQAANATLEEMKTCTQQGNNILQAGACLGTIAAKTEAQGARFLAQSGILIARINLSVATLPAALEMCAGASIVEAGIGTAKIVADIGSCSASSIIPSFNPSSSASSTA